ncbi:MAG: hypothetical protein H0W68_12160 [Gemmatimonadaceae bacterium]|nr:hypothetical protein [Gemmatimonadaceae bacterium]
MRYTVRLGQVVIGHSQLENRDAANGRAWGIFRPGLGWELVQPIFQLFTEAVPMKGGEPMHEDKLERYHAARDRLGLELADANGRVLATSAIHITEYDGVIELEILGHWIADE